MCEWLMEMFLFVLNTRQIERDIYGQVKVLTIQMRISCIYIYKNYFFLSNNKHAFQKFGCFDYQ